MANYNVLYGVLSSTDEHYFETGFFGNLYKLYKIAVRQVNCS